MYLEHFNLKATPFSISPDPRYFFEGAKYKKLLTILQDRVSRGGITVLSSHKGMGKSCVLQQLQRQLMRQVKIVRLTRPNMMPDNLLNFLLFELKLSDSLVELTEAELRLVNWLDQPMQNHRLLLIVEQAQNMPEDSLQALAKICQMPCAEGNRASILLGGSPVLTDNLRAAGVESHAHYELSPLSKSDVHAYLNYRATHVGYYPGDELFDKAVSNRIAQLSDGIPRNIHLLADKVLCAAFQAGDPMPSASHIADAQSPEESQIDYVAAEQPYIERWLAAAAVVLVVVLYFLQPASETQRAQSPTPVYADRLPEAVSVVDEEQITEVQVEEALMPAANALDIDAEPAVDVEVDVTTLDAEIVPIVESLLVEAKSEERDVQAPEEAPILDEIKQPVSALVQSQQALINWLLDAPDSAATIQLLLVKGGKRSEIEGYLKQMGEELDASQLMTYSTVRQGQPYYGVLYQQFADRRAAYLAKNNLPASMTRLGPFITRTAKGVADEQGQI